MELIRKIDYRLATNAFVFTGLWLVIGAIVIWSPIPGALGIGGGMLGVWLVLLFLSMAVSGSMLTIASLNLLYPPVEGGSPSARKPAPRAFAQSFWGAVSRHSSSRGNATPDS
jgi:hypothetical protein